MTDRYAELDAEIARLHGDLDFERDVAEKARLLGPDVVDDSGYFTTQRVDDGTAASNYPSPHRAWADCRAIRLRSSGATATRSRGSISPWRTNDLGSTCRSHTMHCTTQRPRWRCWGRCE